MKRTFLYLFILGFVFSASFGQTQKTILLSDQQIPEQEMTPDGYYTHNIPLDQAENIQVKLKEIKTSVIDKVPLGRSVGNAFDPDVFYYTQRKKQIVSVKIPIYKKTGQQTERLKSYNLSIQYTEKNQTSNSNKPAGTMNSVLASGSWYKISIPKRGIYKMDYAFLQSLGLNPNVINPAHIRLYGNGGTVLPETVDSGVIDDLFENAIEVHASGSSFSPGDYILFYANGPVQWTKDPNADKFLHTNNYYEDRSYYFLNFDQGNGKRIMTENAAGPNGTLINSFNDYRVVDVDSYNVGDIGKTWWSNRMNSVSSSSLTQNLTVNLGSVTGSVTVNSHVGNKNDANGNSLKLSINNQLVNTFSLSNPGDNYIYDAYNESSFTPSSPQLAIQLKYIPVGNGIAYLDYLLFNYKRPLHMTTGQMPFRSLETMQLNLGEIATYQLQNANSNTKVWDLSNPLEPIALSGSLSGSLFSFSREGHFLKEFIAFDGSEFYAPTFVETVSNQNLHGLGATDYLIITNDAFLPAAEELADFHRQKYNTHVTIAKVKEIYNEFSSGGQDIAGIRNFIKMFYDRAQSEDEMINNVLFLGAASYDYKDRINNNTNFVPTYQSKESSSANYSYSSDDFYALLDQGENMGSGFLDIGVGRIPSYTLEESQLAIGKIKNYASPASFGPWKNVVSFVADDKEAGMNHLDDCETANQYFSTSDENYNIYKIYEDAYVPVAGSGGKRFPAVNKAINDQVYLGTFLMSYSGHGSPTQWSHEAILTPADYNNWENKNKLPILITATCDFGRFDDPGIRSAGAKLMLNPNGGAIAMITTTQAVFPFENTRLTKNFISTQFTPMPNGKYLTLGKALMKAKNLSGGGTNDHKFTVLGDPALTLQIPENYVRTDSILMENSGSITPTDTLKALGKYILKGSVTDKNGSVLTDFDGSVYVTIFDKKTTIETINPFPGTTPSFNLQTNIVARIKSNVRNGKFSAHFLVPKDINYDFGSGKISYYAHNDQKDAAGFDTQMTVGGYNTAAGEDNEAPIVKPFIDDEKFRDGGITGPNPLLFVKFFDENGINVSGTSPGHDLVAILDEDIQNPMVMNDYYQTEENDYRNGFVKFPLYNLSDGEHTIRVKAWDAYNNSGEGFVRFVVKNKNKGFISDLYNYPNPVKNQTNFVFQHNQKGVQMSVTLQIFTTSGALVKSQSYEMRPEGNRTEISWDGKASDGSALSSGVYPYRLMIKTEKGTSATAYQKLVLLR